MDTKNVPSTTGSACRNPDPAVSSADQAKAGAMTATCNTLTKGGAGNTPQNCGKACC